jgi:Kef-type K+ transport system membrane component KefB
LKFSKKEAYRVGIGMLPRGEIALIIASVGISYKVIDQELFGISIIMIIITTILAPILLYKSYKN